MRKSSSALPKGWSERRPSLWGTGGEGRRPEKAGFKGKRETHHLLPVRIIFVLVQILPKGDEVTEVSDSALGKGQGKRRSERGLRGGNVHAC